MRVSTICVTVVHLIIAIIFASISIGSGNSLSKIVEVENGIHYIMSTVYSYPITDISLGRACSYQALLNQFAGIPNSNVSSANLYVWYNNQSICLKTAISSYIYHRTSCPSFYTRCPDGYTCVPGSESCPINDIQIRKLNQTRISGYKSIQISDTEVLEFGIQSGRSPFYTITAELSGPPCIRSYSHPSAVNTTQINYRGDGCGPLGTDTLYSDLLSSQTYNDFLSRNGYNLSKYMNYSIEAKKEWIFLYARRVPEISGVGKECEDYSFLSRLQDSPSALKSGGSGAVGIVAVALCGTALLCMLAPSILECVQNKKQKNWVTILSIMIFVVGASFVAFAAGITYLVKSNNRNKMIDKYISYGKQNCFTGGGVWKQMIEMYTSPERFESVRTSPAIGAILIINTLIFICFLLGVCYAVVMKRRIIKRETYNSGNGLEVQLPRQENHPEVLSRLVMNPQPGYQQPIYAPQPQMMYLPQPAYVLQPGYPTQQNFIQAGAPQQGISSQPGYQQQGYPLYQPMPNQYPVPGLPIYNYNQQPDLSTPNRDVDGGLQVELERAK
eukprot:TRINITY_DN2028_c0_g1_i6.p1 TRINITY_DN2028_c0_g1~~TRINITY_DN2028_c0_g1_i6.p1  ORF type:complete len:557 (-),score=38.23 TRINITY_DN2028_c0_g1_i6:93-1763(-)